MVNFYDLKKGTEKKAFDELLSSDPAIIVLDEMEGQLRELIKSLNPSVRIKSEDYPALIQKHLNGCAMHDYGVWVYYPWAKRMIHCLDEDEFVEVRTNRNRYKITRDEQALLKSKKIGVIGLSVGQSIALTLAMERICGEIRLADFDVAELSNLNRLRTGLHNLGLNKTTIAAREILEIDPFIKVKVFSDGLHKDNMDEFYTGDGKLDLLVEVCDGLDIKILSRFKARELQIPVVMDTNDRGMMDVERFDLEPDRPILHGLAGDLDPDKIGGLTNEEKIPYILKMVGAEKMSTRLKASMMEVEQSINTWPQLASSVVLGGAMTTDVCRRILLDQYHESGRYYVDLDELLGDKQQHTKTGERAIAPANPFQPLTNSDAEGIVRKYFETNSPDSYRIDSTRLGKIIDAAIAAPSAGNNQPWKWCYAGGVLFLLHDKYRSWSLGDYDEMGAHIGLGAALENAHLQAAALQVADEIAVLPLKDEPRLIACIRLSEGKKADDVTEKLASGIFLRNTNRKLGERKPLPVDFFEQLQYIVGYYNDNVRIFHTENESELAELGEIIASCDRLRLLNEEGHEEFFSEIRWNSKEAEEKKDGIDLTTVDLSQSDIAGLEVAKDWNAVSLVTEWGRGNGFKRLSVKTVKAASSLVLFAIPEFDHTSLVNVGRVLERAWIFANQHEVSVHPMLSPVFFFSHLVHGKGKGFNDKTIKELEALRSRMIKIFPLDIDGKRVYSEVFLVKLAVVEETTARSLRKPKDEIFFSWNDNYKNV